MLRNICKYAQEVYIHIDFIALEMLLLKKRKRTKTAKEGAAWRQ
jgi:hypothetical protein